MHVPCGGKGAEIARVGSHEYEVLLDTSGQYVVIRRTQPAEVARMQRNMIPLGIQGLGNSGGQTLIKKHPHHPAATAAQATFRQGLPDGRPRRGWVLAYIPAASNASRGISG